MNPRLTERKLSVLKRLSGLPMERLVVAFEDAIDAYEFEIDFAKLTAPHSADRRKLKSIFESKEFKNVCSRFAKLSAKQREYISGFNNAEDPLVTIERLSQAVGLAVDLLEGKPGSPRRGRVDRDVPIDQTASPDSRNERGVDLNALYEFALPIKKACDEIHGSNWFRQGFERGDDERPLLVKTPSGKTKSKTTGSWQPTTHASFFMEEAFRLVEPRVTGSNVKTIMRKLIEGRGRTPPQRLPKSG